MTKIRIAALILLACFIIINGWLSLGWLTLTKTLFDQSYYQFAINEANILFPVYHAIESNLPHMIETNVTSIIEPRPEEPENSLDTGNKAEEATTDSRPLVELTSEALLRTFDRPWFNEQLLFLFQAMAELPESGGSALETTFDLTAKKAELHEELIIALELLPEETLTDLSIHMDEIVVTAEKLVEALEFPDQLEAEYLFDRLEIEMSDEIVEFFKAVQGFNEIMRFWPIIIFLMLLILTLLIAGPSGGLKWSGTALVFFSLSFWAALKYAEARFLITLPGTTTLTLGEQVVVEPEPINMVIRYFFAQANTPVLIVSGFGLLLICIGLIGRRLSGRLEKQHKDIVQS